ncbi:MAG: type II secretion system F family protein [Lachnospiraceae bacterium]|nr:type II secretion system F family protein [Lachnospiraceae bacterium]
MIILYIIILAILIILWLTAKISKTECPITETGYSRVFLAPAVLVHTWGRRIFFQRIKGRCGAGKRSIKNRKLLSDLQTLYPGEMPDKRMEIFRIEIISTIMLLAATGAIVCLAVSLLSADQAVLKDGNVIYRNTYGGMDIEADLSAGITVDDEENEYPLSVTFPARVYSYDEADALFPEMSSKIDGILLGENDRADHILYPVSMVRSVEGYPFSINWECSNYELLDYDGVVHNEELEEPVMVTLTGDCSYRHDHWYLVRDLRICPRELTVEETIAEEIREAVDEADLKSESEESVPLPDSISFGTIRWSEKVDDAGPMILMGVILVCIILIPFKESEISTALKKRSRQLLIEYPAFVSQLTLYMGAGMSVRNCLLKLGHRASDLRPADRTSLDKELVITAHELEVGISESDAIEHFGKRCGTREYMRFSALLIQNMKKGSTDLIGMLKEESEDAFTLRKNEARKLGEEASTKLLLPMVMMLTVVMIIIMVPAYMSFSS